jgi:tRNA(Ile2) C34 agmatinyltransferase TiaS
MTCCNATLHSFAPEQYSAVAVQTLECPVCATTAPQHLQTSSKGANVNYYRCPNCKHVWTTSKREPSNLTHVTPPPEPKDGAP